MNNPLAETLRLLTATTAATDEHYTKRILPSKISYITDLFAHSKSNGNSKQEECKHHNNSDGDNLYPWDQITALITAANKTADSNTTYVWLKALRHGEGWHNVAEAHFGAEWETKYAKLNGTADMPWGPDPLLTEKGKGQVHERKVKFEAAVQQGMPLPQTVYVSPLSRCGETTVIVTGGFPNVRYIVMEPLREKMHVHTCDKRSTKSEIGTKFEHFQFQEGFTESDEVWRSEEPRETDNEMQKRFCSAYSQILAKDPYPFQIISTHSGVINAVLVSLGHPACGVETAGEMNLILKIEGKPPKTLDDSESGLSETVDDQWVAGSPIPLTELLSGLVRDHSDAQETSMDEA